MRFGICTGPENLELLERLGYDYIEMNASAMGKLPLDVREGYIRKLQGSRVKCEAFNILFPKTMGLLDKSTGVKELEAYLRETMAMIQSFGAGVVVFGSGKSRRCPDQLALGEAYKRLVEVCRLTGEIAAEYDITVVIEPLSRKETNLVNTMAEGAMLEADVGLANVRLLSDYFHVMANHDSIESMKTIRNFAHIHIAAGNGRTYPVSEEGEEYAAYFEALAAVGYGGRVSIEGKTEHMEEDAKKALALLKKLEEWEVHKVG